MFLSLRAVMTWIVLHFPVRCWLEMHSKLFWTVVGRGKTDKTFTSTLVIRTFKVSSWPIFLKYGSLLFFSEAKKSSDFHPHRQRRRKHEPLDLARNHYAVSPPERLHFLGLSLHGGITSACSDIRKNFPCSVRRLCKCCAIFVTWWILKRHPGGHQKMVESYPHSRRTHLRCRCSKRPRPVATNPLNLQNFSNTRM